VSYYTALQGAKPYRCDQGFSCCLSSVPRGISLIPEMMGGKINGAFTVLFYENSKTSANIIAGDKSNINLKVTAVTKFPLDGSIDYVVSPSKTASFTLNFRVPAWSENFIAKLGGKEWHGKKGELLSVSRKWRSGEHVTISFDMPLQTIPGGLSYPNSVAFKRGPQVLAIDRGINPALASLKEVIYIKNNDALTGASAALPADWDWKQAYGLGMKVNNKPQKIVMVPFSEAGQKASEIEVWVDK